MSTKTSLDITTTKNKIIDMEDDNEIYYNKRESFDYNDSEYENQQDFKTENEILTDLALKIQNNLVNFVSKRNDNSILPLCEFLKKNDVKYFLNCIHKN